MASITERKAWYDKCFITIDVYGGGSADVQTRTTTLEISGGGFDQEGVPTHGGIIKRIGRRQDFEITFDGIITSHQDFDWIFHGANSTATSITTNAINDCRVSVLWTNQNVSSATSSVTGTNEGYRETYVGMNLVELGKTFEAGEYLTVNGITFRGPYEDNNGAQNFKFELAGTGTTMSALPAYSGSNKF